MTPAGTISGADGAGAKVGYPSIWRPAYAYVPGRSPRHDDDLFDPIKATVTPGPADLSRSQVWRMGLDFLTDGYFWESHELLESVWMACPPNSAESLLVRAIIQYANAGLKWEMGRPAAAARLLGLAEAMGRDAFGRGGVVILGLRQDDLDQLAKTVSVRQNVKNIAL
ncbi:DUF309 domain-containing protein [Thalassovita sp.]|uniref:DUF309 domain-containing protein n=1 Tax=Thalassovita sp. TaxID=1979401 RepID=UPI002B270160|nr:DUF309 domain-containing protein [Thalassovita sp.]